MAREDRRRLALVTVAGAAATVLIVLSLTAGPTLIRCFGDGDGLTACLRGEVVERGLLPPNAASVPANTPGGTSQPDGDRPSDVAGGRGTASPAGNSPPPTIAPAQSPEPASPDAETMAAPASTAPEATRLAAIGRIAGRVDVAPAAASPVAAATIAPPLSASTLMGDARLDPPAAGASPRLRAAAVMPPMPLSQASAEGRVAIGMEKLPAPPRLLGSAAAPPRLARATAAGRAMLASAPADLTAEGARSASARMIKPLALAEPTGRARGRLLAQVVARGAPIGITRMPPRIEAVGRLAAGHAAIDRPGRVGLSAAARLPKRFAANGRVEADSPVRVAALSTQGAAYLPEARGMGPATGSISGEGPRRLSAQPSAAVTLPAPQPAPPALPPAVTPSAPAPATIRSPSLPRVMQLTQLDPPVPAERTGTSGATLPPTPLPATRDPHAIHPAIPPGPVPAVRTPQPPSVIATDPAPSLPSSPRAPSQPALAPVDIQRRIADVHIVIRGDTLWAISRRAYGAGRHYPVIFAANRDIIDNPDLIFPGQKLRIPDRFEP